MKTVCKITVFTLAFAFLLAATDAMAQSGSRKKPTKPKGSASRTANSAAIGAQAPALKLSSFTGEEVDLATKFAAGKTVVVFLRGYPGYQCPICSRQVAGLTAQADAFAQAGAEVVLVYPGSASELDARASEFLAGKPLPEPITLVVDPDYRLVNAYGVRWDAPRETAYPSTYVVEKGGKIAWAKVSKTHGGRTSASEVLQAVR